MTEEQADQILGELVMLRKLAMQEFLDKGYSQAQLAKVLGVSQPTISRMLPKINPRRKGARADE